MALLNPPPLSLPSAFNQDIEVAKFFDAMLRTIYQLWSQVRGMESVAKTLTTDATVTPLQRIEVKTDTSIYIEARVIARRTGGSAGAAGDSAFYVIQAGFKNISGTVSLIASTILNGGEDQASWDLGFAIDGTQAVLVGTGAVNNNISWQSAVSYYEVGI
ncbi:MAG: hypothetical protein CV087_08800 [Candidatus Brocadia sp. WS118]|nr:MAG: hypothetical protein CV087_08800 [Candidatus Brocadia sp. WS118]